MYYSVGCMWVEKTKLKARQCAAASVNEVQEEDVPVADGKKMIALFSPLSS